MMDFLGTILGYIMYWCYWLVRNYGLALVLFTLVTKLALLPLAVKQQKEMARMAMFKPKMDEIQKKYKDNPQKQQEELSALYAKEKYNPMSGCLPMLVQFPILLGLINVIYNPLKHILHFPQEMRDLAVQIMKTVLEEGQISRYSNEMSVLTAFRQNPGAFAPLGEYVNAIAEFDFTFLGIDMSVTPSFSFDSVQSVLLLLIPVLSGLSALVMSLVTSRNNTAATGDGANASMNKSMMFTTPIISVMIGFQVPAGVGIYWLLSNVYTVCQSLILNKIYNPKELAEKARKEVEEERARERQEKLEARKKLKEAGEELPEEIKEKALSQKEINRHKLAAARKRDAEKYGEEYVDVTDEDFD